MSSHGRLKISGDAAMESQIEPDRTAVAIAVAFGQRSSPLRVCSLSLFHSTQPGCGRQLLACLLAGPSVP